MITKEHIMNIRSLAKQGYSQRQIAHMTGLHRKTVKKYLKGTQLPVYKKVMRNSILKPYYGLIEGWLSQEDYQASRIYDLLIVQGYTGSYDTVRRYVATVKEHRDRKAYIRFETMPGKQAQVDFGDFQVIAPDGSKNTVYCFIMVLGYSRHMYIEFLERCTMAAFLASHQHAFGFFGGIPAEILYDNMKNVVIRRLTGKIQWNPAFESFAAHYGFKPLATPPYSPWAKGKVERPIHYVRERFWRGYVFRGMPEANRDIFQWNNTVASRRIHGTTHMPVYDRFASEKPSLGTLPEYSYDISEKAYRKVHKDCQLSFGGNRYVVPHECVGKTVLLKVKDGIARIFSDDTMVAAYRMPEDKGNVLAHPRFYQRLKYDKEQLSRKYRYPLGKAKATRGLLKDKLSIKVIHRPLSTYDTVTREVAHA